MVRPQTIELNLRSDEPANVYADNLLTLRVYYSGVIFWSIGFDAPKKIEFLRNRLQQNSKLVALVKIARGEKYETMAT